MVVKDVMTSGVVTCPAGSTVREVAARMKEYDVGFLPIVENGRITALVTDRDLVTRGIAAANGPGTPVGIFATRRIWTIHENESVDGLAQLMKDRRIRRLIVLDAEDRPSGVVTLGDLAYQGDAVVAGSVLCSISGPSTWMRADRRAEAAPVVAKSVT